MDFKKIEGQIITLMKELNKEMQYCCGRDWSLCKQCRWNKEASNGISICDNHTRIYPNTYIYETVCEEDYDTIEQVICSLNKEISKDCDKYEENCNSCPWNRVSESGQTICDVHADVLSSIIMMNKCENNCNKCKWNEK